MHTGVTTKLTKVEGIPFSQWASRASWEDLPCQCWERCVQVGCSTVHLWAHHPEENAQSLTPTEGVKPLDISKEVECVHACVCVCVCVCMCDKCEQVCMFVW